MSFTGRSPSFNRVRFAPLSADPVNPQEGDQYYSDGTARPAGLWAYKSGSWSQVGSGASTSNALSGDDTNFEGSVGSWLAYADAAASQPADGTGGSPTLTVTRTTSASLVLNGTASMLLTKDAANRQGEGASLTLTVPNYLKGQPAKLRFSTLASANFSFGTFLSPANLSDVVMYLYDVTNSKLLSPNVIHIDSSGYSETQVQIPTDCSSLRIILHVATTNASAWTLSIDDVFLGIDPLLAIQSSSDWVNFGAVTIGATTTAPTKPTGIVVDRLLGRRDGSDFVGRIEYAQNNTTSSAAGSGDYLFTAVPAGLQIDTDFVSLYTPVEGAGAWNNQNTVGTFTSRGVSVDIVGGVSVYSTTQIRLMGISNASDGAVGSGFAAINDNANMFYCVEYRVPIKGWTSGSKSLSTIGQNVPAIMRAYKNGGSVTGNAIITSWTAKSKDSTNSFDTSTGVYTVKAPGDYFVSFQLNTTTTLADTTAVPDIYLNGTRYQTGTPGEGTSNDSISSTIIPDLKIGDTLDFRCQQTRTLESVNTGTSVSIYKIETPQATINIPKIAYVKDIKASGTAGGTFTSGADQTRVLNTLEGDGSFISLSSNQFTLQPGTYAIEAMAPGYQVNQHKAKLRNITDASDVLFGTTEYTSSASSATTTFSKIIGTFSITAAKTFEIQHRCSNTVATNGFGALFSTLPGSETYTIVKLQKLY